MKTETKQPQPDTQEATVTVEPLRFELCYRKEAYDIVGPKHIRRADKDDALPERPPQFSPMRGSHSAVASRANLLNKTQERSGFRHYFFFPEVAPFV